MTVVSSRITRSKAYLPLVEYSEKLILKIDIRKRTEVGLLGEDLGKGNW